MQLNLKYLILIHLRPSRKVHGFEAIENVAKLSDLCSECGPSWKKIHTLFPFGILCHFYAPPAGADLEGKGSRRSDRKGGLETYIIFNS